MHISGAVEKLISKVDDGVIPGVNEKITSLSMLSFERQEFMRAMEKVRLASAQKSNHFSSFSQTMVDEDQVSRNNTKKKQ